MPPRQLDLFGPPPRKDPDFAEDRALAERLPRKLRLGTSSWTFPGWAGIVYPDGTTERDLAENGLTLYVRCPLFRTVGIDRSYYRPLERKDLSAYAKQIPPDFPCVMKVWNEITSRVHPATRERNPRFLDPSVFLSEVLGPVEDAFAANAGPFVFEFPPLRREELPPRGAFADELSRFFAALPRGPRYAVELRNRELFTPAYLEALAAHGVAHVLNFWERMPTIGEQLRAPGVIGTDFTVARLLIPPGERYAEKKAEFAPFDHIVTPQPALHEDVAKLVEAALAKGAETFVIANNKAEGSSPLTLRTLARRIVSGPAEPEDDVPF
ncbi:MAG TPA: DUF72 domain-containing protein [Polyangiaceae bacterium]|nr:DUF72 domain-containing protein [Polyangiaceae bacterium]